MSSCDLPVGISIRQARLENQEAGMLFEIDRGEHPVVFGLREEEAISVALAILGVSIDIREGRRLLWRPRLLAGGRQ